MVMGSSWGRDQWLKRDPEEWSTFPAENAMADDDKPSDDAKPGRGDLPRPRGKASAERPFDMWLQKQLHAMYDEIASEPLPNDLLRMIDHDAALADGKDKPGRPDGDKKP